MTEFFEMGGYGFYIWSAYGLSALGIGGLVFVVWRKSRAAKRKLDRLTRG